LTSHVHDSTWKTTFQWLVAGLTGLAMLLGIRSLSQVDFDEPAPVPPSIVFIYVDDMAPWAFGEAGYAQAHTPNIDQLAREGARFANAFVTTPVCSPSRATLMTSRYASEVGIDDFLVPPGLQVPGRGAPGGGLPDGMITFAEILQSVGYRTGLVGKWHLGFWQTPGFDIISLQGDGNHPTQHGFDVYIGPPGNVATTKGRDPILEVNGAPIEFRGIDTVILTRFALEFIEENVDRPFFLSLNLRAPHTPWLDTEQEFLDSFGRRAIQFPHPDYPNLDEARLRRFTRLYLASVASADRAVGAILLQLQALGIAEETIVVFASDNGYNMGHNGIWHKGNGYWITDPLPAPRGGIAAGLRPNMYDNSLKVPTIVRWPGVITPGTVIDESITNLDWYPTFLEMAGTASRPGHVPRGRSIVPLLSGQKPEDWDNDVYAEYNMRHYSIASMRTYRTPEWKLTLDLSNFGRDELYDLRNDPQERHNLIESDSTEARRIMKELKQKILEKMVLLDDPLLPAMEARE
jgi:uncharacterized sulfatase